MLCRATLLNFFDEPCRCYRLLPGSKWLAAAAGSSKIAAIELKNVIRRVKLFTCISEGGCCSCLPRQPVCWLDCDRISCQWSGEAHVGFQAPAPQAASRHCADTSGAACKLCNHAPEAVIIAISAPWLGKFLRSVALAENEALRKNRFLCSLAAWPWH